MFMVKEWVEPPRISNRVAKVFAEIVCSMTTDYIGKIRNDTDIVNDNDIAPALMDNFRAGGLPAWPV